MLVDIDNDPDNWKKWGELVRSWVFKPKTRPKDVGELRAQMLTAVITGTVTGPATKKIEFVTNTYSGGRPLKITLPTKAKVTAAETNLAAIAAGLAGPLHYPLPSFYPFAFAAGEVNLSPTEMLAMGRRRLGEYVIQECQ